MRDKKLRISSLQLVIKDGGREANIAYASKRIRQAKGADLIILPELWNIGYMSFDEYTEGAESVEGKMLAVLRELAREVGAYLHTGSFVEKEGNSYFNSSYLLSPQGEILGKYKKIHLFGYESKEAEVLSPGTQLAVATTPHGRFGLATCYDLRFPEMFRRMVDMEAEVFLVCSAWPYPRLEHWLLLNRVRALENQCFLVSANSVGPHRGKTYVGHSMIVDPWGVVIASGGDEEVTLTAELDLLEVIKARKRFPALADRADWLQT